MPLRWRAVGAIRRGAFAILVAVVSACTVPAERSGAERPELATRAVSHIIDSAVPVPALQPLTLGALHGLAQTLPLDRLTVSATPDGIALHYTQQPDETKFSMPTTRGQVTDILSAAYAIARRAAPDTDSQAAQFAMIREAIRTIDPPGRFLDPKEYAAKKAGQPSVGLDLRFRRRGEEVVIVDTVAGGPSALAGLQPGERLVAIDDTVAQNLDPDTLDTLLRGPPDTNVRLTVAGKDGRQRSVVLVRVRVSQQVTVQRLTGGIAYLQLRYFTWESEAEVAAALHLGQIDPPAGVLLDLRQSKGGLLDSAVVLAGFFLGPDRLVATLEGRGPRSPERLTTQKSNGTYRGPLVILVDQDTAAGAEMLAAALRERGRARLVGTPTFGNDRIRTIFPLPGGSALDFTTQRWLTPNSLRLDGKGLVPDVAIAAGGAGEHWHLTHGIDIEERQAGDAIFRKGLEQLHSELTRS